MDRARNATPASARELRTQLVEWFEGVGMSAMQASSVGAAAYEAIANAVEHAYPLGHDSPMVRLHAHVDRDQVAISISDRGHWQMPRDIRLRGQGLALMLALVDDAYIDTTPQGTTIHLWHKTR